MKCVVAAILVHVYSAFLNLAAALLLPLSRLVPGLRRWELPARLTVRGPAADTDPATVWLHAASLGECKLLCRFVSLLERRHSGRAYIATAVTTTGVAYLSEHAPSQVRVVGLFPLDTVERMRTFVRLYNVRQVWIMETELWPSMIWVCRAEGIRIGVVNGRIEPGTLRAYRRFGWLFKPLVASLDVVLAQDERYARRYRALGLPAERIHAVGNLKSHIDIAPPPAEKRRERRTALGIAPDEPVLTAGCVHPGEGAVVRELIDRLADDGVRCRAVVVPRHHKAVSAILEELGEGALRLERTQTERSDWRLCLIDRYGILEDMYSIADIALVGGTFVPVGGHNVWDAAQFGIPVLFGPTHHEQQQSCDRLVRAGVGFVIDGPRQGASVMHRLLDGDRQRFAAARDVLANEVSHSHDELIERLS
ncbi:MAG: hypothetical protein GF331_07235 [Chitinivibrionales bacterium]|nr:hypothetical protein [Chitinivibrionales bacterium]